MTVVYWKDEFDAWRLDMGRRYDTLKVAEMRMACTVDWIREYPRHTAFEIGKVT